MKYLDRLSADWFVKPGMTVYDIGSFDGASAAGYLARGAAAVYAFEPLPRNRDRMPPELRSDPRFHLLPLALSDSVGLTTLKIPPHNDGGGSLSTEFAERIRQQYDAGGWEEQAVDVTTLDALSLPPADFWKIDVEGVELALLRGAEATLRRAPPTVLQVEIFKHSDRRYVETLEHLRTRFRHVWALGGTPEGKVVHYNVHPKNFRHAQFHLDLARAGTPHYYASMLSFWDLIGQEATSRRRLGAAP